MNIRKVVFLLRGSIWQEKLDLDGMKYSMIENFQNEHSPSDVGKRWILWGLEEYLFQGRGRIPVPDLDGSEVWKLLKVGLLNDRKDQVRALSLLSSWCSSQSMV